jgi:transcriptional regulator with XRE-family HTH domain
MAGLGEILQRTRRSRGISLEEAERVTHIARRYLTALEGEDFSAFPAPVFAKGFLRNYSQYLGLDPAEMLSYWPDAQEPGQETRTPPETKRAENRAEPQLRPARPVPPRQTFSRASFVRSGEQPSPLARGSAGGAPVSASTPVWVLAVAIVVSVLGVGALAAKVGGRLTARVPAAARTNVAAPSGNAGLPAIRSAQPTSPPQPPARSAGKMPNVVGKDGAAAAQQLQQSGVTPLLISVASRNKGDKPGVVLRQEPSAGTSLKTNSAVTLVINSGAAPTGTP